MRVARIEIGWDFLLRTISGHELTKVVTDIPDDARVLAVDFDPSRRVLNLTTESASFADIPENWTIPNFNPAMTVSVTEMSMLADLVSRRHDAWMNNECPGCGESISKHWCPS